MKKFYTVAFLAFGMLAASNAQSNYELKVLDFEGAKWSALIDDVQYGGKLLYGDSGMGFYSEDEAYSWYDEGNTELTSTINNAYGSWCYWSGGIAVSNYYTAYESASYQTQLGVDYNKEGNHGYNNSENFAVCFGYNDVISGYGTDGRSIMKFADGQARVIDHMYINTTSYFLNSVYIGDGFNNVTLTENSNAYLLAQGYDVNGDIIDTLKFAVIDKGEVLREWKKFDLSSLGEVVTLKLDWQVTDDLIGAYGLVSPAYIAVDNIAVRFNADAVSNVDEASSAPTVVAIYSADGKQLTEAQPGLNIFKMSDGTTRKCYK